MLLSRAGSTVSREEIRQNLWPADTFVDFEHGLNTSVKKLRQVLCDSAEQPRYIETMPRLGYRFIAPVEVVPESPAEPAAEANAVGAEPAAVSLPSIESQQRPNQFYGSRQFWRLATLCFGAVVTAVRKKTKPKLDRRDGPDEGDESFGKK